MLYLFYAVISIGGALYFALKKRRFDAFSLAYFSCLVYFSAAWYGIDERGNALNGEVYVIFSVVEISLLALSAVYDAVTSEGWTIRRQREPRFTRISATDRLSAIGLCIVLLLVTSVSIYIFGITEFFTNKTSRAFSNYLFPVFPILAVSSTVLLLYAVIEKSKKYLFLSIVFIIFLLFSGDRTAPILAALSVLTYLLYRDGEKRIAIDKFKQICLAAPIVFVLAKGKLIYGYTWAVVAGNASYSGLMERIPKFFDFRTGNESFTIQLVLNKVVETHFRVEDSSYILGAFMQVFPAPRLLGFPSGTFNTIFQNALFPSASYGMAYNYWAEGLAVGGWPGFFVFLGIFLAMIWFANRFFLIQNVFVRAVALSVMAYWCFYIHRNSLLTILAYTRHFVYICGCVFVIACVVHLILSRSKVIRAKGA